MWQDCGCEKVTCDETGIPCKDHPQISRQNYPRHLTVLGLGLGWVYPRAEGEWSEDWCLTRERRQRTTGAAG